MLTRARSKSVKTEEPTTVQPAASTTKAVTVTRRPTSPSKDAPALQPTSSPPKESPAITKKPLTPTSSPSSQPTKRRHAKSQPSHLSQQLVAGVQSALSSNDKRIAQRVGVRLRTLLKLPKAHRWVCYEWFYANIDRSLFMGENDFCACLRETFPQLKARKLTRIEWCKIRRLMGKPRRCSPAFFAEERAALNSKRQKVRQLQQQKVVDISHYRDLPDEIPLSLVIDTKVTALLHKPHDGLFTGTIDAVDTANHGYRITFDRPGIGTHLVPDYEVLSNDPPEFLPLTSFQTKVRPRLSLFAAPKSLEEGMVGSFPTKSLTLMVKLHKILACKRRKIYDLRSMNTEVERLRSIGDPVPTELKRHYAGTILELESLNNDLEEQLKTVQDYYSDLAPKIGAGVHNSLQPQTIKRRCAAEARDIVEQQLSNSTVTNEKSIDMISRIISLMVHLRAFSESEVTSVEFKSLFETVRDVKGRVASANKSAYEDNIEIHIKHMIMGFSGMTAH